MKHVFYLLIFCNSFMSILAQPIKKIVAGATLSPAAKERLGVSGPLQFNKTSFHLAWSDKPNETYYVQEYMPTGENPEHFNQLLTINLFNRLVPIEDAVKQKAYELTERKKIDATCNFAVTKSKDGQEYMIDFILSEGTGDKAITEFNIYHYKQIETSDKKQALAVYAYSKRSYGNSIPLFFKNLQAERPALLQAMSAAPIPDIKLGDQ